MKDEDIPGNNRCVTLLLAERYTFLLRIVDILIHQTG